MPITIETYEDFATRNGNDAINVDGMLLFGNGAQHGLDTGRGTWRKEPPTDETEKLQLRYRYVKAKLERAKQDFYAARTGYTEQAANAMKYSNLPAPGDGAVLHLQDLANEIQKQQNELAKVNKQLADTPWGQARTERAQILAKRQDEIRRVHMKLLGISPDGILSSEEEDEEAVRELAETIGAIAEADHIALSALAAKGKIRYTRK